MDVKKLTQQLTLEEKATLCVGGSFWHTAEISRLKIPNIMMIDGPSGINKLEMNSDHTCGQISSLETILFPCASCTSCSFDRDIIFKMGEALGDEMVKEGISLLLGPGVNIKRSPLCGRNFEYYSEDPYLSTILSSSLINGIQSKGVGSCIKHFACNNQETKRFSTSANIDERTLREIYLTSFEGAIKHSKPWAVMSSYNQINGIYSSENYQLLTKILRDEWKYDGFVVSDWNAVNDRIESLKAGVDLDMPGSEEGETGVIDDVIDTIKQGEIDEKLLDIAIERLLKAIFKSQEIIEKSKIDSSIQFNTKLINVNGMLDEHHRIAVEIAENSIVLLKNEDSILPLPSFSSKENPIKILFVGEFAKDPHAQGAGSARVEGHKISDCFSSSNEIIKKKEKNGVSIDFTFGYDSNICYTNENYINEAIQMATNSDIVVIFAGTEKLRETENYDSKKMKLPKDEEKIISEIVKVNKNVVVVLQNGSAIEMPWINDVKAVVETFLCGEGGGEATANILFGIVNPSGHLAESFPLRLEDTPAFGNFGDYEVEYKEGIFVGYRHYDKQNIDVLFPFGHGLSYTKFEYKNIRLDKNVVNNSNDIHIIVAFEIKNIGSVSGKTVAQLYVSDLTGEIERPLKELKGFEKVDLKPGELKTVKIELKKRSFAWWNTEIHDWFVSKGKYQIIVGQSSRDKESLTIDININF